MAPPSAPAAKPSIRPAAISQAQYDQSEIGGMVERNALINPAQERQRLNC
jgi:hypothetical protein